MTTSKLSIVFVLFLCLSGCAQTDTESKTKHIVNPKARQLNDSAMTLTRSLKDEDYQKAIMLFDQAIEIDSNYTLAYWNKLSFQTQLKQYDKAIQTAKQLTTLSKSPYYYF